MFINPRWRLYVLGNVFLPPAITAVTGGGEGGVTVTGGGQGNKSQGGTGGGVINHRGGWGGKGGRTRGPGKGRGSSGIIF